MESHQSPAGPKSVCPQAMAKLHCSAPLANGGPRQGVTRAWVGVDKDANGLWKAWYSRLQDEENTEDGCRQKAEGGLS